MTGKIHIDPMAPERPGAPADSAPLLIGSHTVNFEPASIPCTDASKDASVINDVGDNKQLEFISQRSEVLFDLPRDSLLVGTGATFISHPDTPGRSAPPSQPAADYGATWDDCQPITDVRLKDELHDALEVSECLDDGTDKEFLPFDKLGELINMATIEEELRINRVDHPARIPELATKIGGITSRFAPSTSIDEKTTRRKLFAILVLINKVPTIVDLINEQILDSDLPFTVTQERGRRRSRKKFTLSRKPPDGSGPRIPVKSLEKWERHELESFFNNQWKVMAPFLQLSKPNAPKVHHYPLDPHIILPFIPDPAVEYPEAEDVQEMGEFDHLRELHEGGCSEVRKVLIHPHHHNLFKPDAPKHERNPYFAVKILREGTTAEAFEQEVHCLKRLMEENHGSLVRLLGTFEHRKRYHLLFPWADANLQHFFEQKYPDPSHPPRDARMVRWLAREFLGLAEGLKLVHHASPIRKGNTQKMDPVSQKIYGRHGDVKTTNILWFGPSQPGGKDGDMGVFQIADFGFTAFHSENSIEVPAQWVGRSPTHRAPECDGTAHVSPSSDFWSFGAVLLEFAVWYVRGWHGWKTFSQKRSDEDESTPQQDKYFGFSATALTVEPVIKPSVRDEINSLRRDERCSAFIGDLLDLIQNKLLVISPKDRAKCDEIVNVFREIRNKCLCADYCVHKNVVTVTPPPRPLLRRYSANASDDSHGRMSLDSQYSRTTASASDGSDSFMTTQTTPLTRETTLEDESGKDEQMSPSIVGRAQCAFDRKNDPRSSGAGATAAIHSEAKPSQDTAGRMSRQNSGRLSRQNSGRLSRQNSDRLSRQNSGRLTRQNSGTLDSQAGGNKSAPPPCVLQRSLRKRGMGPPSVAGAGLGLARCSLEAQAEMSSNLRKRKASDDIYGDREAKIPRRSTA